MAPTSACFLSVSSRGWTSAPFTEMHTAWSDGKVGHGQARRLSSPNLLMKARVVDPLCTGRAGLTVCWSVRGMIVQICAQVCNLVHKQTLASWTQICRELKLVLNGVAILDDSKWPPREDTFFSISSQQEVMDYHKKHSSMVLSLKDSKPMSICVPNVILVHKFTQSFPPGPWYTSKYFRLTARLTSVFSRCVPGVWKMWRALGIFSKFSL